MKESFVAFVTALAAESENAEMIEKANPKKYVIDGAHNWKNADIASFLYAALSCFNEKPLHDPSVEPDWKMFAEFLYCGKIIE